MSYTPSIVPVEGSENYTNIFDFFMTDSSMLIYHISICLLVVMIISIMVHSYRKDKENFNALHFVPVLILLLSTWNLEAFAGALTIIAGFVATVAAFSFPVLLVCGVLIFLSLIALALLKYIRS